MISGKGLNVLGVEMKNLEYPWLRRKEGSSLGFPMDRWLLSSMT